MGRPLRFVVSGTDALAGLFHMKLKIILDNGAGELASHVIKLRACDHDDESAILTSAVVKLLGHSWFLSPGDTIRIVEVEG
jgi:hypothetical protein